MFTEHWEKDDKEEAYNNEEKDIDMAEQCLFPLAGNTYNRGFPSCSGNHNLCGGG